MPGSFLDSRITENLKVATEYFQAMMSGNSSITSGGSIGFIPFKMSFTMDGLSGIKIYNELKVDTSFLPLGYSKTLKFIVTGIDHKLSKNDWETTINTTLIPITDNVPKITGSLIYQPQKEEDTGNNDDDTNPRGTGGVGDLYTWSKGYASTAPDFPTGYVADVLNGRRVSGKNYRKPTTSPPTKSFEGNRQNKKKTKTVWVTKYKWQFSSDTEMETFNKGVLTGLGAPTSAGNLLFLKAWAQAENSEALFNPWATTQVENRTPNNFNADGPVQNYFNTAAGIKYTIATMTNRNYPNIIKAFKKSIPDQANGKKLASLLQTKASFSQTSVDALINSWP